MASTVSTPWQERWLLLAIWAGLFLLLLMPLVVTPSTLSPFIVGKATYTRGLIEIIFALWGLLALASPHYRPGRSWILLLFGLLVAANLLAALFGASFQRSFWGDYRRMGGVFDLTHWFALLIVLASVLRERAHWRWLLNTNLGVSLVLALLGLAQRYDVEVFQNIFWYFESGERLNITFGNATYVGAYMLVNVLVALAFLAHSFVAWPSTAQPRTERRRRLVAPQGVSSWLLTERSFWALVIVLDLWVLTLSGTRGAIIGLAGALLFAGALYALWGSYRPTRLLAGVATATLLVLMVGFPIARETDVYERLAARNVMLERLREFSFTSGSGEHRVITARIGLEAFADSPVLGWGPENFIFAFDRYVRPDDFAARFLGDQAHNRLVNELTTTGIVGFTAYLLLWGRIGWVLVRRMRSDPEHDLFTVGIGAALAGYFIQNLFLFDVHATFLQALVLMGWVASAEASSHADSSVPQLGPGASGRSDRRRSGQGRRGSGSATRQALGESWSYRFDTAFGPAWRWAGLALFGLILVASLYFMVYRPYRAAQLFPLQQVTWQELWTEAKQSFETFPPLATLPRQVLFDTLVGNWDTISAVGTPEILGRVQPEEQAALESEPENPRLYLVLAELYQQAAATEPGHLKRAREYLDTARRLAPELTETLLAMVNQRILEEDYRGAQAILKEYQYANRFRVESRLLHLPEKAAEGLRSNES